MTDQKEQKAYKPKIKRQITVPLMKLNTDEPVYVKFTGDEPRLVQLDKKAEKEPATVLRCIDVTDGEVIDLIASTVLKSQLVEEFGGIGPQLKGVALMITSTGKRAGKEYNDIRIAEIEA